MNAALALAAEHDLAGRYDDAVNALARATQDGDLDAMTELGKRLVSGDKGPLLPVDGASLRVPLLVVTRTTPLAARKP